MTDRTKTPLIVLYSALVFAIGVVSGPMLQSLGERVRDSFWQPSPIINFDVAEQTRDGLRIYVTNDGDQFAVIHRLDVCPPGLGEFVMIGIDRNGTWERMPTNLRKVISSTDGGLDERLSSLLLHLGQSPDAEWHGTCNQAGIMTPLSVIGGNRRIEANSMSEVSFQSPVGFSVTSLNADDAVAYGPVCVLNLVTNRSSYSKWFPCHET